MSSLIILSALIIYLVLALTTLGIYWYSANHAKLDPEQSEEIIREYKFFNKILRKNSFSDLNMGIKKKEKSHQFQA